MTFNKSPDNGWVSEHIVNPDLAARKQDIEVIKQETRMAAEEALPRAVHALVAKEFNPAAGHKYIKENVERFQSTLKGYVENKIFEAFNYFNCGKPLKDQRQTLGQELAYLMSAITSQKYAEAFPDIYGLFYKDFQTLPALCQKIPYEEMEMPMMTDARHLRAIGTK